MRGGGSSTLYEIDPTPDGGLAKLTPIYLSLDKRIDGTLNGLESLPLPPAPAAAIDAILEIHRIVADNPGTQLADKLEDAIAKLETAFADFFRTPPDNQAALGIIEGAVGDLVAAANDDPDQAAQLIDLMNELAGIAREIAVNAVNEAILRAGDPSAIADAQHYLADGDALRASAAKDAVYKYKDALSRYKDALAKAESA